MAQVPQQAIRELAAQLDEVQGRARAAVKRDFMRAYGISAATLSRAPRSSSSAKLKIRITSSEKTTIAFSISLLRNSAAVFPDDRGHGLHIARAGGRALRR